MRLGLLTPPFQGIDKADELDRTVVIGPIRRALQSLSLPASASRAANSCQRGRHGALSAAHPASGAGIVAGLPQGEGIAQLRLAFPAPLKLRDRRSIAEASRLRQLAFAASGGPVPQIAIIVSRQLARNRAFEPILKVLETRWVS
ncbi:hypothetical protein [Paracoccus mutanolyticus]|nr:hypothetical protein [Paracoccus mutanolyticus]